MMEISREFTFQAAHHLPLTPEDHKCHNMHGHTWTVRIWLTGELQPEGWILDYADIVEAWGFMCEPKLDHTCLNDLMPNPTTENLALWIWGEMRGAISRITCIEIQEGPSNRCRLVIEGPRPA